MQHIFLLYINSKAPVTGDRRLRLFYFRCFAFVTTTLKSRVTRESTSFFKFSIYYIILYNKYLFYSKIVQIQDTNICISQSNFVKSNSGTPTSSAKTNFDFK